MDFEELKLKLQDLLEFPADLIVENEKPPLADPEDLKACCGHDGPDD